MQHAALIPFVRIAAACLLAVCSLGCSETVDPFVGEERPFTIWGYLDAGADTQRVRVFSIEERLGTDRSGPIDARVTSVDLDTGEHREWRHEEVAYADGTVGHLFWSDFRPQHEHRYRLEVARSDGAVSSATSTVPPRVEVTVPEEPRGFEIPVRIEGRAPRLVGLGVTYEALPVYPLNPWPPGTPAPAALVFPATVSYAPEAVRERDGWSFKVNMRDDFALVQQELMRHCLPGDVALRGMELHFLAADSAWHAPEGLFDPELLVEPGTLSNVENGYGFFGAGQAVRIRWVPPARIQSMAGFTQAVPCATSPSPECVVNPPCFRCEDPTLPAEIRAAYCPVGGS